MKPEAFILCGGSGSRFMPWQERRHKCTVLVDDGGSGVPLVTRHARFLLEAGFKRVSLNPPKDRLREFQAALAGFPAKRILFFPETRPMGSAYSTACVLTKLNLGKVAVVNGDTVLDDRWYGILYNHAESKPERSVIGVTRRHRDSDFTGGIVRTNQFGTVLSVEEGAEAADGDLVNVGAYVIDGAAVRLHGILHGEDLMKNALPKFLSGGRPAVYAAMIYGATDTAHDIGTPERYASYVLKQYGGGWFDSEESRKAAVLLACARDVLVAGNGGSSAIAAHAVLDWRKAGGAEARHLCDAALATAHANDDGADNMFAAQIGPKGPGKVLVLLSVSGDSPNIVKAAMTARERGIPVIGLTRKGSKLHTYATHPVFVVRTERKLSGTWGYGPPEDSMSVWCHAVTALMEGIKPWSH